MMRRLLALMLCICMIGSMTVYAVGDETEPVVDDTAIVDDAVVEDPTVEEPTVEPVVEDPYAQLRENLLAAESIAAFDTLLEAMSEEEFGAFLASLSDEQLAALNAKSAELEAKDVPAVEPKAEDEEEVDNRTTAYETVSYTNAAPFLAPVEGVAKFRLLRAAAEEENEGMGLSKTVSEPDENGQYTITLEAFATGEKTITAGSKNVPTDIILVLDQSGSMTNSFTSTVFNSTTERNPATLYNRRNNLYVKVGSAYEPVAVTINTVNEITYQAYAGQSNSTYYSNRNSLYHLCSEGQYGKVTVNRTWSNNTRTYTYTCANCGALGTSSGSNTTPAFASAFYRGTTQTSYTYTFSYTDAEDVRQTVTVAANESAPNWDFYISSAGGSTTRLAALKSAVTTFASSVATKAKGDDGVLGTDDDVDHTISVVGFANTNNSYNYSNTEIFIGSRQYTYGTSAQAQYTNAPQDMSTSAGVANVTASVGALTASGATYIDRGIELANGILNANPVPTGETRNRVVVIFTDGAPGYNGNYNGNSYGSSGDAQATADRAMTAIATTKTTHGATVYTVGIFTGADATSAGSSSGNATERANYFMQRLSSNTAYPQTPSYYLSASDSSALTSIFKTISENIESGGSSITLNEEAIVRDIISDQFQLPAGANADDITVYTADYTAEDTFAEPAEFDATVTVSDDGKTISVSNFDFAENWVGTETGVDGTVTYRGKKLIIEIPVVERTGFLGGNNVPTNEFAGVYEDADAEEPLFTFEAPELNVPLQDITVAAPEQNIYLLGGVSKDVLDDGTVTIGDVPLDLDAENYGLEPWQYEYVNIAHTVTDSEGNVITADFANLTDDETYTVTVTVTPKTEGVGAVGDPAERKSGNAIGKINVFKPELTFADSTVYYGDAAPADYSGNLTSTEWKHNGTAAPAAMGAAPALTVECTPDAAKIVDGKIGSKQDINVDAAIKLGDVVVTDYTTFVHTDCSGDCSWNVTTPDGTPAFLLHVKTCQLTVTKTGGASGESYVFTVKKDGNKYTEVTIVGNGSVTIYELPVGTYSITEDTGWSWRYTSSVSANMALSSSKTEGAITCNNTLKDNTLLNGYSDVIANIFGVKH